ncbi:MAG TPA: PatB family C-S lyase [Prolixibacteraceae bacterium]|nr:PatB family C-S lyase [Prolixibacteraceae bacterium]
MSHNFDEIVSRENSRCEKYDNREMIFGTADVLPMWVADTDFRTPDFIVEAIRKRAEHEVFGYPAFPDFYFEAIRNWLWQQHSWKVDKSSLAFCPNVVVGIASAVISMTSPGDKIIVQPPVYFPFFHVVEKNNRLLVENPLKIENGKYCFDFDDLLGKLDSSVKMLLLCSPHNPGGRVWSKDELQKLSDICRAYNIIIVSDEIHSDLTMPGVTHFPFAAISPETAMSTVTVSSASKTFNIAGLSSAYVVISNPVLMEKYNHFMEATHIGSGNIFGLTATEAAYNNGNEWLNDLRAYVASNHRFLSEFFRNYIPKARVMEAEGSFLSWVDISELGLNSRQAAVKLANAGIGISPGYLFGHGGDNFIRINVGCPQSVLEKALIIMKQVFSE